MQHLHRMLERTAAHCEELEVGSEEYNACVEQITALEQKLNDARKIENDLIMRTMELEDAQKARKINIGIDIGKAAVGSVIMPLTILTICILAEKELIFSGTSKSFINSLIPRKY